MSLSNRHTQGQPQPHAPPMPFNYEQPPLNLSNLSIHALPFVDPLQQPYFFGNGTNQLRNISGVEVGKSLTHSKPTELMMYS